MHSFPILFLENTFKTTVWQLKKAKPPDEGNFALCQPALVVSVTASDANYFARRRQVSTTVSGLSEMDSMPCSISQAAKSAWSDGP